MNAAEVIQALRGQAVKLGRTTVDLLHSSGDIDCANLTVRQRINNVSLSALLMDSEAVAGQLVNATSPGDIGDRSDHFLGSTLGAQWVQEASAPSAVAVGSSSLIVTSPAGNATHYLQTFTPSGAFRIEARVRAQRADGTNNHKVGIFVRDSGTGDASGNGMLLEVDVNAGSVFLYSFDAGVYTIRKTYTPGAASSLDQWVYLALARDASNNWLAYFAPTRVAKAVTAPWLNVFGGAAYNKVFTVAKAGFHFFGTVTFGASAADFFDITA